MDRAALRYWTSVAIAAVLLAGLVGHAVSTAGQAQQRWGRTRPVLQTTGPVRAGAALDGATRIVRWPIALVPTHALAELPPGARAAAPLDRGTALTESLVDQRRAGSAPTRRTVAVALDQAPLPVTDGDRVDVWSSADPSTVADGHAVTRRVASGALVEHAGRHVVVLSVVPADVAKVADAAATGTITLVGTG